MAAVRARVADKLVTLVKRLRQVERFLRAVAVEAVGGAPGVREIVERRRRHALCLRPYGFDRGLPRARASDNAVRLLTIGRETHGFLERFLFRGLFQARAKPGALIAVGLARESFRAEGGDHLQ